MFLQYTSTVRIQDNVKWKAHSINLKKVSVIVTSHVILGKTTPLDFSLLIYNTIICEIPLRSSTKTMNLHKCLVWVYLFHFMGNTEKIPQNFF